MLKMISSTNDNPLVLFYTLHSNAILKVYIPVAFLYWLRDWDFNDHNKYTYTYMKHHKFTYNNNILYSLIYSSIFLLLSFYFALQNGKKKKLKEEKLMKNRNNTIDFLLINCWIGYNIQVFITHMFVCKARDFQPYVVHLIMRFCYLSLVE